jgi:hypothetical protein
VEHLVFASSSSVYGANTRCHFQRSQCGPSRLSRRQKADELDGLPIQCLNLLAGQVFTVYGPGVGLTFLVPIYQGHSGETIDVFNYGR